MEHQRKQILSAIDALLRKAKQPAARQSSGEGRSSLVPALQMLRGDVILLLNHCFYLSVKLEEKSKEAANLTAKNTQLQEQMSLELEMSRKRFEKQLHSIQFKQFSQAQEHPQLLPDQESKSLTPFDSSEPLCGMESWSTTIKKSKQFREVKNKAIDGQEVGFDLEMRLGEGVLSEQMSQQLGSSEGFYSGGGEEKSRHRRGRSGGSESESMGKKKSEQLAELVAQQFKVPTLKQKYFSTDLQ